MMIRERISSKTFSLEMCSVLWRLHWVCTSLTRGCRSTTHFIWKVMHILSAKYLHRIRPSANDGFTENSKNCSENSSRAQISSYFRSDIELVRTVPVGTTQTRYSHPGTAAQRPSRRRRRSAAGHRPRLPRYCGATSVQVAAAVRGRSPPAATPVLRRSVSPGGGGSQPVTVRGYWSSSPFCVCIWPMSTFSRCAILSARCRNSAQWWT